jgi:predicted CoA-binding protein
MSILQSDREIRTLLEGITTIAVVGLSDDPGRDSHHVARYLVEQGYTVIPVNPRISSVFGVPSFPNLESIGGPVDLVDIFRRPEHVPAIVDSAIRIKAPAVWMQLGVASEEAVRSAASAGLDVVADKCIMVEHIRLLR